MTTTEAQDYRYNGRCKCGQRLSLKLTTRTPSKHHWVTDPNCGARTMLTKVEGTFKADVKCDPRCTGAHGNTCTCSCGGINHGADHGMMQVVAVKVAKPVEYRTHLGEVDRHIVGFVTVATKTLNVGRYASTLLTFQTDQGDILKWFAPADKVPAEWVVGRRFKLRAKVKYHEDHEAFGKATVIIYPEEVNDES